MKAKDGLHVAVGYDAREHDAYLVCRHSIVSRTRCAVVEPLDSEWAANVGLYWRPPDPLSSTAFTFTRFLLAALSRRIARYGHYGGWTGGGGWWLFCDCDFVFTAPLDALFALADDRFAVMVVKHDHRPPEAVKMDGARQRHYARKNWSSLVLWNAAHPANRALTEMLVNTANGLYLHQFRWLDDEHIGALPETWNWLEGWCAPPASEDPPKAVHFTRGGPWLPEPPPAGMGIGSWDDIAYADLWWAEKRAMEEAGMAA